VQISDKIWLRLKLDGFYLIAANVTPAPTHAAFIQRCFQAAGIRLKALQDPEFYDEFQPPVPKTAAVLVISNRELNVAASWTLQWRDFSITPLSALGNIVSAI
jgi:hypothetical protein